MEMEWNGKWDWENLVSFGSKGIESPKKLQLADWTIVDDDAEGDGDGGDDDDDDDDGDTFNTSGSDVRHTSSAKSSVSASTDSSSCKDRNGNGNGMHAAIFRSEGSSGNLSTKIVQVSETSPAPEVSVGFSEALLGLKLGKRTYFENSSAAAKSNSFPVMPAPATITPKKTKSSAQNSPTCQVEGCNVDLSLAKEYHRKHRVCNSHSKCPKVIVGGRERRFCQQCSRFHSLSEFDEKKCSCRRRLSDHNARRRKPQQETIQFNSPQLSSACYEGSQQMSFVLNNSPAVESRIAENSGWNNSS